MFFLTFVFLVCAIFKSTHSFSDVGKWDLPMNGDICEFTLAKSLFKGAKFKISLHCDVADIRSSTNVTVTYLISPTPCSPDYFHYFEKKIVNCSKNGRPTRAVEVKNYTNVQEYVLTCNNASNPVVIDRTGVYVVQVKMQVPVGIEYKGSVRVEMISPSGYMSASMWPLLPFFGVMCGVYTILCTAWLIVCGLQWRDLLRIQYWIGGVALLGMVESATYYGVYSSINRTGYFNIEAYIFAEWVSVAKRALARMLVIIVSLGFGIVKPRLGGLLQRVLGAGSLWALLAAVEAWLRLHRAPDSSRSPRSSPSPRSSRDLLLAEAPLSLLDSALCWWVFVSLAHTMRTLQLRRNAIKLSLYRHFTNTLIFAVISSVIFMLYSIKSYRVQLCITDWKEVWMDEAYWHILFASVLTVIMILWRPTNNNQRYAFTPLLDNAEDDDDEEEQFVNDAYGVKMRGTSIGGGEYSDTRENAQDHSHNSLDSDLRWVEENIPTSTLPLLDSDEEILNTKFEVSKMQ